MDTEELTHEERLSLVYTAGIAALEYVSLANYHGRAREARNWLRWAMGPDRKRGDRCPWEGCI